jgi:hypothetical protein
MAAGGASVDTMLADAISKMDAMNRRLDALETGEGHKNPIKGDGAKDDDDDDKKDDSKKADAKKADAKKADAKKADAKKADDDDDDKKDDATTPKNRILDDDDDDDKKDDALSVKKGDDGELEIKHEPEDKKAKKDASKKDSAKKADAKKADAKKADDDDDKKDDDTKDDDDDDDDKKDDAAKADSATLRRMIQDQAVTIRRLEALMKPKSDDEHAAFADAQARADAVFNGFGQRAPRPLEGEALLDYRKRLATKLKSYSPVWKSVKFSRLDDEAFGIAETQVYADAISAASNPTDLEAGELRQVTKTDPSTGVRTIVFYGKDCFVKQMGRPGRRVQSFRTLASQ